MASIPGFRFDISGASGSQGLLGPKSSWRAYVFPRGGYAAQDSTGTTITFDSASVASRFAVNSWIQAGLLTSNIRQVGAVGGNSISVSGAALTVSENTRILLIGNTEPTVTGGSATYTTPNTLIRQRDDDAADLYTNSMITTNADGLVQGFGATGLYDVLIQDGNQANQGVIIDLAIGVPEGISVSDPAIFGSTVTITGPVVFGATVSGYVGPSGVAHAEGFTTGSSTGGIQEAIDYFRGAPGYVMCKAGVTYSNTLKIWLHSGITLLLNGATLLRATGSISNGQATASGDVIGLGPYGANGSQFTGTTQGSAVSIVGPGRISGNSAAHAALTDTNLGLAGIRAHWTTGLTIVNVDIEDCLQDGIYCNNNNGISGANIRMARVGQWGTTSSRNGISLMNNDNSTTNTNQGAIAGLVITSAGDEAIAAAGLQGMAISGIVADGHEFGIEFTSASTVAVKDNSFSGGVFRNGTDVGITFNATAADAFNNSFNNLTFDFHGTSHNAGLIYLSSSTHNVYDTSFNDIRASNVNSLNTSNKNWIDCQAGSGKVRQRLTFNNVRAYGLSTSIRTGDVGYNFRGACTDITVSNGYLKYVAGIGFAIDDSGADYMGPFDVSNFALDWINHNGYLVRCNGSSAHIDRVTFNNAKTINCARQGGTANAGWRIEAAVAGCTLSNFRWNGCESYANGSTQHHFGINFQQSAGTITEMMIDSGTKFTGVITDWFGYSGTIGTVRFKQPAGRGTDIAAASTIQIPPDGEAFHLTGTTTVNTITVNPWDYGRLISLINDSTAQVADSGNQRLSAAGPNSADDTLTLRGDTSVWYEAARSAN